MADEKKIVTQDVFEKAISDVLQIVVDNVYVDEEYTEDEVSNLFDGTSEEIDYYSSLISDTLVSENRIFSSKHVTELVQQAVLDSNAYADGLITNISSIELKYTDALPATGNANTIYILKSTTSDPDTLNLYNDGAWIKIGDFNINLDDYATTDYVNTKLDTKANSSEVLAVNKVQTTTGSETNDTVYSSKLTKDELDKKVNVTDLPTIATALSNMSTNNDVAGAKAVYDELLKIANDTYIEDADNPTSTICKSNSNTLNTPYKEGLTDATMSLIISVARDSDSWNSQISISMASNNIYVRNKGAIGWCGWKKFLTETDITTTIDSSSTDTQVPSAKTIREYSLGLKYNYEFQDSDSLNIMLPYPGFYKINAPTIGVPKGNPQDYVLLNIPWVETNRESKVLFGEQFLFSPRVNYYWRRTVWNYQVDSYNPDSDNGTFNPWQRVCATTVADVPKTNITFSNETNYSAVSGSCSYYVENGSCTIMLYVKCNTPVNLWTSVANVPKSKYLNYYQILIADDGEKNLKCVITPGGALQFVKGVAGVSYVATFSYPVAES